MTQHKITFAIATLVAGLAVTPAFAAGKNPNTAKSFTATTNQVKEACKQNGGTYYEEFGEANSTYGCETDTGASVLCWKVDNHCDGFNPNHRSKGKAKAALPKPRS